MANWLVRTLQTYPELAIFLSLAIGFAIGMRKVADFSLGNVTATLLAAVAIGQLGIAISHSVESTFFVLFISAVGYGVGPQFVSGLTKEGPRQIGFSLVVLVFCLLSPVLCAKLALLDLGYPEGLYAGSLTISPSIGVASGQIGRLDIPAQQAKIYLDQIPIGYAVTYIFGTIGSTIILAQLGPRLSGADLEKACKDTEQKIGNQMSEGKLISAIRHVELRAYRVPNDDSIVGRPVRDIWPGLRVFLERVRRGDEIIEADGKLGALS